MLALAVGMFQLMLDRGQTQDWFNSTEILAEATISGLCFYLFVVHMFTADRPFLSPALFKDRNFLRRHHHGGLRVVRDAGDRLIADTLPATTRKLSRAGFRHRHGAAWPRHHGRPCSWQ